MTELKSSGIGKAVMFLYKHPKEVKSNKQKLEKLIQNWSRKIYELDNKPINDEQENEEERRMNRATHLEKSHKHSVDDMLNAADKHKSGKNRNSANQQDDPNKVLRPGDPGFCPRARVPIPSNKDYKIKPRSTVDSMEASDEPKKPKKIETRLEKHQKRFIEIKRSAKSSRAVSLSVSGK